MHVYIYIYIYMKAYSKIKLRTKINSHDNTYIKKKKIHHTKLQINIPCPHYNFLILHITTLT